MEWKKGKAEDEKDRDVGDEGQLCTCTDQQKHRYRCRTKKMRSYRIMIRCIAWRGIICYYCEPEGELLVSVRKIVCRTFKSYLSVCLSMCVPVNNAVRYNLPVLSAI